MYTIKEVSQKLSISEHTLRFWAKSDFFPLLERNKNNVRIFSDNDLKWVGLVKCLRAIGVENKVIKEYINLCLEGDSTIQRRFGIIKDTKQNAKQQLEELNSQIELLEEKEKFYENLIKENKKDLCNPANA